MARRSTSRRLPASTAQWISNTTARVASCPPCCVASSANSSIRRSQNLTPSPSPPRRGEPDSSPIERVSGEGLNWPLLYISAHEGGGRERSQANQRNDQSDQGDEDARLCRPASGGHPNARRVRDDGADA